MGILYGTRPGLMFHFLSVFVSNTAFRPGFLAQYTGFSCLSEIALSIKCTTTIRRQRRGFSE